jgi:5-methyltetrahydropteroyltriglutamate--homocysteine methyltransferase
VKTSVVGFPRIGEQRELKKSLEAYWSKKTEFCDVEKMAKELRARHWEYQKDAGIDLIAVNDFSLYDNMLDMIQTLGAIPKRFRDLDDKTYQYFSMARGNDATTAMEMTKWFNTNYHYIVPELALSDEYKLDISSIKSQYDEAKACGINAKINLIGPITFLAISKRIDGGDTMELFSKILPVYEELVNEINKFDSDIIIDFHEPIFVSGFEKALLLLKDAYNTLAKNAKVIVTTFFEHSNEATKVLLTTPIYGLGLDFVDGEENIDSLSDIAKNGKKLFAGVISGRNIWINDLEATKTKIDDILKVIDKDNLIISTSCSLLHTPFTLKYEDSLDKDVKSWLAYAKEKLDEVSTLSKMFCSDFNSNNNVLLQANIEAVKNRKTSKKVHNDEVKQRVKNLSTSRDTPYDERIKLQREVFKYPNLATTTIGSFPQTVEIRTTRREFKNGTISEETYEAKMKELTLDCIKFQEEIDLDILVHGEFERNDMVEYFGEQMSGFAFSKNGWVQSYGSRCVKPPVIYGDVSRPNPMTVKWSSFANDNTKKIMKGMLTGPVTILNWSFVRDDQPRSETSYQISVAISDEVKDLETAGVTMIQVDEAAFKEGYPLRKKNIPEYERWAVECFKATVSPAKATTQIHTHMCYSEFNDIIKTIEAMDADVISIETARSGNELLKIFKSVGYKQEVGPGIYDIHSPRVPSVDEMVKQIEALMEVLPKTQLWINPDCGLKTRKWDEVKPSLKNMVEAVKIVRNK